MTTRTSQGGRYGHFVARSAKWIALAWLVGVVLAFAGTSGAFGGGGLFGQLQQKEPYVPGESHFGNEKLLTGA